MSTNSKFILLATENHPLYHQLKKICDDNQYRFYDIEKDELFEEKQDNQRDCQCLFDFTCTMADQKMGLLSYLDFEFDVPIVSELSYCWGELYFQKINHLEGAISTLFTSPTKNREVYCETDEVKNYIDELFSKLGLQSHPVQNIEIGFTFPRILSMIINEAYYALEDELASPDDLDRAMEFGVNYPQGPIQWSQEIGTFPIRMLLDELYQVTGDPRYRVSKFLRLVSHGQ